jgi:hypothetical protein
MGDGRRRCTRVTWRLGCALRNLHFFLLTGIPRGVRLHALRTGASFAWALMSAYTWMRPHRCLDLPSSGPRVMLVGGGGFCLV